MDSERVLGSPPAYRVFATLALVAATVGLLVETGLASLAFVVLAVVVAWRLFGLSVSFEGEEMVVRNILKTARFPVDEIDIRARVVDPRREAYSPGRYPEPSDAPDDNTSPAAKWYELIHGEELHSIDALAARSPAHHELLALELRRHILNHREVGRGDG